MASDIIFSSSIKNTIETLENYSKKYNNNICFIVDENTCEHCLKYFAGTLYSPQFPSNIITIKSGEENKNLETCVKIWNKLTVSGLDRKSLIINLGGGVIGDMGGFCASTFLRGLDFIQIPTTLLSQVDASVGGKLGIDFNGFKNHIGVFKEPIAVIIDPTFLLTLDVKEIRSGFAEIIKHCLIADKVQWDKIKTKDFSELDWEELARHSVEIKKNITTEDPIEKGLRKILNFGHTIGHAVESRYLAMSQIEPEYFKKILHGEAIAIGMICESWLSYKKGFIKKAELDEISAYILKIYGKEDISEQIEYIYPLTVHDKKNENHEVLYSLLQNIGSANYNQIINYELAEQSLHYYASL